MIRGAQSESDAGDEESGDELSVKPNVEELEMLLEAYFAQIDGILQKLSTVRILIHLKYISMHCFYLFPQL